MDDDDDADLTWDEGEEAAGVGEVEVGMEGGGGGAEERSSLESRERRGDDILCKEKN